MNDQPRIRPVRGLFALLKRLFLLACLLIAALAVGSYAAGWIVFRHDADQQRATIEIETREARETAERAVEKGRQFVDELAEQVADPGERPEGANEPESADSPPRDEASSEDPESTRNAPDE
jgi:hypothetical protein